MKNIINKSEWNRLEHFNFFSSFKEPFWGLTENVDFSLLYRFAKDEKIHFYSTYLYLIVKCVNEVEEFKMRYSENEVYGYDVISVSPTVLREDNTFGFSYVDYQNSFQNFSKNLSVETLKVKQTPGLNLGEYRDDVIHFSSLPWFTFSSLSHARSLNGIDSCPKISIGKITQSGSQLIMPVSVHVNHALVDGYHMHLFFEKLKQYLACPDKHID